MPVKMIAVGRYYDRDAAKEYKTGQPFVVADDKTADRLVRSCKARRDVVKPAPEPAKAEIKTKVMKAETPPEVVPEPAPAPVVSEPETPPVVQTPSPTSFRSSRYRRNDMRSED